MVILGRMNRKAAAESRYALYNDFRTKNLAPDTVYLIDQAHIIHLKHLFQNKNVGFFYRDNFWAMVMNEKALMNDNDKLKFNEISFKLLDFNKKIDLNFAKKIVIMVLDGHIIFKSLAYGLRALCQRYYLKLKKITVI